MGSWKKIAMGATMLCALVTVGCRRSRSTVAVLPRTTATLLWEPMHQGVVESARGSGLHVYWNAPSEDGDVEKQLAMFDLALKQHCRGLIVAPVETLAFRTPVLRAINNGVPVVVIDDELGPPSGPLLSYVSTDEAAGTRLAAERVARILGGHGSIAVIGISPRLEGGITRAELFESALAEIAPKITIRVRRFGDPVITHQQQIAQEVLRDSERLAAIVALTATATRGAYYARLASQPRSTVSIVGFDQDLLLPIQSGDVDAVVAQDTRSIGQAAMRNVQAQMQGQRVPGHTRVPPLLLTKQSLAAGDFRALLSFSNYDWSGQ